MGILVNSKTGVITLDGECTAFKVSNDTISMSVEIEHAWFGIAVIPSNVDRMAFIKKAIAIALEEQSMQCIDSSVYKAFGDVLLDDPGNIDQNAMLFGCIANRITA